MLVTRANAIAVAIRPPEDSSIIWTAAAKNAMQDYMFLWAGQSSPLISHDDADALIESLIVAGDG